MNSYSSKVPLLDFAAMALRPTNLLLPFGRSERARNLGHRLGRKKEKGSGTVPHRSREAFDQKSAVHVTLRFSAQVPSLRARHRFRCVREAFVRFRSVELDKDNGFRLVHFNVLGNHAHLIVEADSREALSIGMRKLAHSISRRLNARSVERSGGSLDPRDATPLSERPGWLGRVFCERYHAHRLLSAREIENALSYVLSNAQKHFGSECGPDVFSSAVDTGATLPAKLFLLNRAYGRWRAAAVATR